MPPKNALDFLVIRTQLRRICRTLQSRGGSNIKAVTITKCQCYHYHAIQLLSVSASMRYKCFPVLSTTCQLLRVSAGMRYNYFPVLSCTSYRNHLDYRKQSKTMIRNTLGAVKDWRHYVCDFLRHGGAVRDWRQCVCLFMTHGTP